LWERTLGLKRLPGYIPWLSSAASPQLRQRLLATQPLAFHLAEVLTRAGYARWRRRHGLPAQARSAARRLPGRLSREEHLMLILIPCPECGVPAETTDRFALTGTDGPVEHLALRCSARHQFRMPANLLPAGSRTCLQAQQSPAAPSPAATASQPSLTRSATRLNSHVSRARPGVTMATLAASAGRPAPASAGLLSLGSRSKVKVPVNGRPVGLSRA
jgi:hypothetical protein